MFTNLIYTALQPILKIVDKNVLDKDKSAELRHLISVQGFKEAEAELNAQKSVLIAEITGDSWLGKNWRPITMLTFVGLITAHWLGFTAPNISDAIVSDLLGIVKVGIGGYVIGRSGEKIMKVYKGNN